MHFTNLVLSAVNRLGYRNKWTQSTLAVAMTLTLCSMGFSQTNDWNQWRGPNRDGILPDSVLPNSLKESDLKKAWSIKMGPSYSGPIIVGDRVFVTETKDKKYEVVRALDRTLSLLHW